MAWYLAPSLAQLRAEVNARWLGRDKTSDGSVGDTSHQARASDHNPDYSAGGIVRAIDVDKDGMDAGWVIACVIQDVRTNYVIHKGLIYQRVYGFAPRPYYGVNAHMGHVHISIRHGRAYEVDTSAWLDNAIPVSRPVAQTGGSIPTPTGSLPGALTPEDDMSQADVDAINKNVDQAKAMLQEVINAIGTDKIGLRDLTKQAISEANNAAVIASDVRNAVGDPKNGVQRNLTVLQGQVAALSEVVRQLSEPFPGAIDLDAVRKVVDEAVADTTFKAVPKA